MCHPTPHGARGKHYLPSLASAHSLGQCNNFKDPGVQHYGGPLFRVLREAAEKTFVDLPPPKPAGPDEATLAIMRQYGIGAAAAAPAAPVDMSQYYDRGGGCFAGDSLVHLASTAGGVARGGEPGSGKPGSDRSKRADALVKGDVVVAFRMGRGGAVTWGAATVRVVCETEVRDSVLLVGIPGEATPSGVPPGGGVRITPWHPILLAAPGGSARWAFPAHVAALAGVGTGVWAALASSGEMPSVFSVALEVDATTGAAWHGVLVGGVGAIGLGHGIEGDPVASHATYGSEAHVEELAAAADETTGRVCLSRPRIKHRRHRERMPEDIERAIAAH